MMPVPGADPPAAAGGLVALITSPRLGRSADVAEARMVLFRAGGERFALPLEAVREVVVPQPPFARVPRAAAAVRGAINLRGRVVGVVDLAAVFALPAQPLAAGQGHVLVLDRERRGLGLLVGSVLGVEAVPPPVADGRAPSPLVRGVAELPDGVATVLDADALEASAAGLFGSG